MPPPILTPAQIAAITTEQSSQQNLSTVLTNQTAQKTARVAELTLIDSAFKGFFDYHNDQIIAQYDSERRALDGTFTPLPIIELDLTNVSNLTGRLLPTPPATEIVRIPEFDGGGTSTDPLNETQQLTNNAQISNTLQNGYGSGVPTTATTTILLTSTTTTLSVTNLTAETITPGDFYVIEDGADLAVIEVGSLADGGGADPPFLTDLNITVIVPPTTSVGIGSSLIVFTGFTDAERTAKTASNPNLQGLMDSLVQDIEDESNARVTSLDTQDLALNSNEDPDEGGELAAQLALNSTARVFIQNYLVGTDVSDSGLATLAVEKTSRDGEISTRVSQILANYVGQTQNYYDERFNFAASRGDLLTGTLRVTVVAQDSLGVGTGYAASAQTAADALGAILP